MAKNKWNGTYYGLSSCSQAWHIRTNVTASSRLKERERDREEERNGWKWKKITGITEEQKCFSIFLRGPSRIRVHIFPVRCNIFPCHCLTRLNAIHTIKCIGSRLFSRFALFDLRLLFGRSILEFVRNWMLGKRNTFSPDYSRFCMLVIYSHSLPISNCSSGALLAKG